jgi:hypothetical protein
MASVERSSIMNVCVCVSKICVCVDVDFFVYMKDINTQTDTDRQTYSRIYAGHRGHLPS